MRVDFSGLDPAVVGAQVPGQPGVASAGDDPRKRREIGDADAQSALATDPSARVSISRKALSLLRASKNPADGAPGVTPDQKSPGEQLRATLEDLRTAASSNSTGGDGRIAGAGGAGSIAREASDESVQAAQRRLASAGFSTPAG